MRDSNATFDTANALDYKSPVYLVHFDGEIIDYANRKVGQANHTVKLLLDKISGLTQKVTPEEGKATVGNITATLLDLEDEITALLATDAYYFHRKKTTIKAGYMGMAEVDMLTVLTGWVTGLKMTKDLTGWEFSITDPQKWLQRKIFRGAESATVTVKGNPINIVLALLTSTGNGTNGDYDYYSSSVGLGIDTDYINMPAIEAVRDDWYPGDSNYMSFSITKRENANAWLQREIFKVLNIYPVVDGDGRFNLKPFKPPIASRDTVQSLDEDNIIGLPSFDTNLAALINECEFHYDYDGDDYATQEFNIDGTSVDNRGPGRTMTIKSRGVHTSHSPASISGRATEINQRRKAKVFGRWSTPPVKINCKTFFSRWLSDPGDIVPLTHRLLPDLEAGTRGLTARRMEITNRQIDWIKGEVSFDLLDTGFDRNQYTVISPCMTVVSGVSVTQFRVSTADGVKFEEGWVIDIFDAGMRSQATDLEITSIASLETADFEDTADVEFSNTTDVEFAESTGYIVTVGSSIGATPAAGWIVTFSGYGNCVSDQQFYGFLYASGHGMGEADIICP